MVLLLHVNEVTQLSLFISECVQEAEAAAGAVRAPVVPGSRGVVSLSVRSAQQVNMKPGYTRVPSHTRFLVWSPVSQLTASVKHHVEYVSLLIESGQTLGMFAVWKERHE